MLIMSQNSTVLLLINLAQVITVRHLSFNFSPSNRIMVGFYFLGEQEQKFQGSEQFVLEGH